MWHSLLLNPAGFITQQQLLKFLVGSLGCLDNVKLGWCSFMALGCSHVLLQLWRCADVCSARAGVHLFFCIFRGDRYSVAAVAGWSCMLPTSATATPWRALRCLRNWEQKGTGVARSRCKLKRWKLRDETGKARYWTTVTVNSLPSLGIVAYNITLLADLALWLQQIEAPGTSLWVQSGQVCPLSAYHYN